MKALPVLVTASLLVFARAGYANTSGNSTHMQALVRGAHVGLLCDPNADPVCPIGSPIDQLVSTLINDINATSLPSFVKSQLIGAVNQIPTQIANLTPAQRAAAVVTLQRIVSSVQSLPPSYISAQQAAEIIDAANQAIAALSF